MCFALEKETNRHTLLRFGACFPGILFSAFLKNKQHNAGFVLLELSNEPMFLEFSYLFYLKI